MKKITIPVVSAAALMAVGIAFAEDTTTTVQPGMNTTTQPMTDQNKGQTTGQNQTTNPPAIDQNQAQTTTQPAPGTSGFAVSGLQAGKVMMASSLIGSTVYSTANENVGDVNDLIIGKDGKIQGVVIGVGGFLGLGEKNVLVPLDRIQFGHDENNNVRYTITASRQELEQAPTFDRTLLAPAPAGTTTGQ